jgi:Fe-S cluster assembly iron-binding protein IscA
MLTVTDTAREKLGEYLQQKTTDPEVVIRIITSSSTPNSFELVYDTEAEGDKVVKSKEGKKVLLIAPDLAPAFEGMVIDCQETPQGVGLAISKLDAGT